MASSQRQNLKMHLTTQSEVHLKTIFVLPPLLVQA